MDIDQIQHEDDLLIVEDAARAVEEHELIAYYQPIVDAGADGVVGAEALVRYTMSDGTIVPAGLFVPALDRTDTIFGLDWYMAEEVCGYLQGTQGTAACVPVSLNFSLRHATMGDFAQTLVDTLQWHGVDHGQVRVELDCAALLAQDAPVCAMVASVEAKGFHVVADNCAINANDLRTLKELGVCEAKLSQAFWSAQSANSLAELVDAARQRDIELSAGGVEDDEDRKALLAAGITRMQGFFFARPMDGDALRDYCK
ncbi:MAG: EAL domain-containing protein [Coriobacteriales bacterium]|nr:EAL domain-containing protein [Coriobacteriales bacterium]